MLSLHPARKRKKHGPRSPLKVGLAIAGGGPIGGMYELGALRALDEALDGIDLTRLDCYVGVSSGAFLAAGLANRISTEEMCRGFITGTSDDISFRPDTFLRPNVGEYLRRMARIPELSLSWTRRFVSHPGKALRWSEFMARFGEEGWDDIPISRAVQASSALPGLYPPVEIGGRHFLDGALRRTMHASTVLDRGIDLMIGVNPLVPFDANQATPQADQAEQVGLASGGLPAVLSQTLRTLLQSRMQIGMEKYPLRYPDIDQLVFEPNADDSELFFTNLFSFSSRHRVCQLAYRNTLADLRKRAATLKPMLAAHGIRYNEDIVQDRNRSILAGLDVAPRMTETTARLRRALDDVDQLVSRHRAARHS